MSELLRRTADLLNEARGTCLPGPFPALLTLGTLTPEPLLIP